VSERLKSESVFFLWRTFQSTGFFFSLDMRYVAAYLLAVLGGNKTPSKADVTSILESVGLDVEADRLDKVWKTLVCTYG